jgi:hypothetical protein
VVERVVDLDHLAVHLDGVRDEHLAGQQVGDDLGDGGLAVAGRAVEEHRAAGVDGRPELVEEAAGQHQVLEGFLEPVDPDERQPLHLQAHQRVVLRQRNRRPPGVGGAPDRLAGRLAAPVGQGVVERGAAETLAAPHVRELLLGHEVDDLVDDAREGQPDLIGDPDPGEHPAVVDELQRQIGQEAQGEPGVLDVARLRRREIQDVRPL